MGHRHKAGIFCVEGPWEAQLTDRSTVRPLFELLENLGEAKFIYRDIGVSQELERYLEQWTEKQYRDYRVGYFAFHGSPGRIWIGRDQVDLVELATMIRGKCRSRIVHFDSCEVLNIPFGKIEAFRAATGALAVSGFTERVDWIESAAFTLSYLSELSQGKSMRESFEGLEKNHGGACRSLGFRAAWNGGGVGKTRRRT